MKGVRVGFRLKNATQEVVVQGRITDITGLHDRKALAESLMEIEQLVNDKLPHLRLHLSMEH